MLKQVQFAPRVETIAGSKGRESGSKWGQLGGAALGAGLIAAGAIDGGVSIPAGVSLVGGTAGLGGMAGGALDQGKAGKEAMQRRIETSEPQLLHSEASEKLRQSLMALHEAPPEVRQQYAPQLMGAYMQSLHQDNDGFGGMA